MFMYVERALKLRKIGRWVTGTWIMQIVYNAIKQMFFSSQFFSFPDYKDYIQERNLSKIFIQVLKICIDMYLFAQGIWNITSIYSCTIYEFWYKR